MRLVLCKLVEKDSKGSTTNRERKLIELSPKFCAFGFMPEMATPSAARQGFHAQNWYDGVMTLRTASGIHVMRTG